MEEQRMWYYFTFGSGQKHCGHYVKRFGTYGEARQQMVDKYGDKWAFQYSEDEWKKWENDPNRGWDMETELVED